MKREKFFKSFVTIISLVMFAFAVNSCDSWMNANDNFYSNIEEEVRIANAPQINVYVRYAATREGTTVPNGTSTVKVEVPFTVSCTTETEYGFYKWAAFSTQGEKGFSASLQHRNMFYVDDEDYQKNYAGRELGSNIVSFENPRSESTKVTVHEYRSDVIIMPIVAQRPTIATSLPANGDKDVVRNMAIRVAFSKPMDESTLIENGHLSENVSVFKTAGDFDNMTLIDISDLFTNISLGSTRKTLTIRPEAGKKMEGGDTIRVVVSPEVRDSTGYNMADSSYIQFKVGYGEDDLAPKIDKLSFGTTSASAWGYNQNVEAADGGYFDPSDTSKYQSYSSKNDNKSLDILTHRTNGKLRIYLQAQDINGNGDGVEDDVFQVYAQSEFLSSSAGITPGQKLPRSVYTYKAGRSYPEGSERTIGNAITDGYEFDYDLSALPDGMSRVDVGVADVIGNDSFTASCVDTQKKNYYKSLYVVVDKTAPNATEQKNKIETTGVNSGSVVWYNATTLNNYSLKATSPFEDKNKQTGFGSKDENIKWNFSLDNGSSWYNWDNLVWSQDKWAAVTVDTPIKLNVTGAIDGKIPVMYRLMDDVGNISEPVVFDTIHYDNTNPSLGNIQWTSDVGTAGFTTGVVLSNQNLTIPFTEETSGIKKIKIEVSKDGSTFATPFADSNLKVVTSRGTELTGSVDAGDTKVYVLKDAILSDTISIKNISIGSTPSSGEYKITVSLFDSADNVSEQKEISIYNDSTKPIVEKVEIPGLKKAKELYKGVTLAGPDDTWWINQEYIGGTHDGNYAATKVPLYITIKEDGSGVNIIQLSGTLKLQSSSTLWTVADDGTETAVDSSKYKINTASNTITINDISDSLKNASGKSNFVILIKDLRATGIGGDTAVKNTVGVKVSDVALNDSDENTTITHKGKAATLDGFYTDSWACGMDKIEIVDEKADPIPATDGYTNDELVTIYAACASENKGASGHNRFVFTGAKFTETSKVYFATSSSSSSTALNYVKSSNLTYSRELSPTEYVISADKTTIELRNADASEYYVFRANVALKVTDMQLDDVATNGSKTVKAQAFDLAGWKTADAKSANIIFDNTKPEWRFEAGTFAANKSETINGEFIYPHPDVTDTAYGIKSPTVEQNKDGEIVRYYYTASKISGTANYGVVVGIGGKDSNLRGYDKRNGVPYYICDTTKVSLSEVDAKYVATHGSMPSTDCNGNTTGSNSAWKTEVNGWEIMLAGHTYSIVIVDEAGNYSTAKTIKIVQDTTKPSVKLDGSKSLAEVFTLDIPAEAKVFRNESRTETSVTDSGSTNNLYDSSNHTSRKYYSTNYVIKGTSDDYKIVIKLNGRETNDVMLDGKTAGSSTSAYTQKAPTATDSGLAYYAVSHWYADWQDSSSDKASYKPAFPLSGSNVPDGSSIISYMGYGTLSEESATALTPKCSWHPYIAGNYTDANSNKFDTINSSVDSDGNISISIPKTEKTPPLALLLKDNCGNMNYILIRPASMETDQQRTISYVVDNMLSTDTSAPANRHVGFIPYATTNKKANDSNVTNDSNYKAIDLNGDETESTYNWGNPAGPYQIGGGNLDGQTVIGTQARDLKSGITYYNEKAYIGLALKAETCNFSSRSVKGSDDGNGYTLRARVIAWDATGDAPAKTDFDGSGSDFSSWVYLRDDGSDGNNNIFLQYPHPSRTSKFRLYYYVEDAVGNYEINTIVNDNKADGAADQMLYWMYDNEKPSVKTRSGDDPATITGSDINKLVATNNGFRPYYNAVTGTGYIVETKNKIVGTGLPDNNSLGQGVILGCLRGEDAKYGSYFDLNITETSGIRAFAYTSTSTAPAIPTSGNYGTASMGDNGTWYAGMTTIDGRTGMLATREIGSTLPSTYYPADSGKSLYSNAGDVTYDYYDASYGNYVYSGVKVVATIPYGVIKGDSITPKDVYLHVMDWVGNITTVKLGDGIQWVNDSAGANNDGNPDTNIFKDNCNITCYNIEKPWNLQYTFASTKIPSGATSIKIYMPEGKYSDDAGSGLLGWSLTPYKLNSVEKDAGQTDAKYSYIEITDGILTKIKNGEEAGEIPVYIYDNVGNCAGVTLKLVGDKTPVDFTLYARGMEGTTKQSIYLHDTNGEKTDSRPATEGNGNVKTVTSNRNIITNVSDSTITATVYTPGNSFIFLPNFGPSLPGDWYSAAIENWNGTAWDNVETSDINNKWQISKGHVDTKYHSDGNYYFTSNTQTINQTNPYYRLAVRDKAGNESYAYIKIVQDKTPPTVTLVEGSITNVYQAEGINYFNSNSKAKIKYADAGSGLSSYGSVSSVPGYVTKTPEIEVNLGELTPANDKIIFTATDNLGNGGSINLSYSGVEKWAKDESVSNISGLTINSPSSGNGVYFDSENNKLYYNSSSIKITPVISDADIDYFYYNDVGNKSAADNSFTFNNPTDGTYSFFAVDKLGNKSAAYDVVFEKKSTVAAPTKENTTFKWYKDNAEVTDSSYIYERATAIFYNSNNINKIVFTPSASDTVGIVGYAASSDAATWGDTVTVDSPNGTVSIYAKDKVGNVSPALTYSITQDMDGPTPPGLVGSPVRSNGWTLNAPENVATNTATAYDSEVGNNYMSYYFHEGSTATITVTVTEADSGLKSYCFVIGDSDKQENAPAEGTFVTDGISGNTITAALPDSGYHGYIWIFLKDNVGNVTKYPLGQPSDTAVDWLKMYKPLTSVNYHVERVYNGYIKFEVSGLNADTPIKSLTLTGVDSNWSLSGTTATVRGSTKDFTSAISFVNSTGVVTFTNPVIAAGGSLVINFTFGNDDGTSVISAQLASVTDIFDVVLAGENISDSNNFQPSRSVTSGSAVNRAVTAVKSFFQPARTEKQIDLSAQQIINQNRVDSAAEISNFTFESSSVTENISNPVALSNEIYKQNKGSAISSRALSSQIVESSVYNMAGISMLETEQNADSSSDPVIRNYQPEIPSGVIITVVNDEQKKTDHTQIFVIIGFILVSAAIVGVCITSKRLIDNYR